MLQRESILKHCRDGRQCPTACTSICLVLPQQCLAGLARELSKSRNSRLSTLSTTACQTLTSRLPIVIGTERGLYMQPYHNNKRHTVLHSTARVRQAIADSRLLACLHADDAPVTTLLSHSILHELAHTTHLISPSVDYPHALVPQRLLPSSLAHLRCITCNLISSAGPRLTLTAIDMSSCNNAVLDGKEGRAKK